MSSELVLKANNLSKAYHIYKRPIDRLKQMLYRGRRCFYDEFWALRNLDLEIFRGETVGVIGRNGSGKSTFLQLVCGTLQATTGSIEVNGRIAGLLELGAGFNPEFTGRENVYLNASILGLTQKEIEDKFDSILAFADIGDFVNQPVKTYSSGMYARLAFAVASSVNPDILLVDEILSVGDAKFQARCFARLRDLKDSGTTILFVSHSCEEIVAHCSKAVLLEKGEVFALGQPKLVVNKYLDLLFDREKDSSTVEVEELESESQSQEIKTTVADSHQVGLGKFIQTTATEDNFSSRNSYNKYEYRWGDERAAILDYFLEVNGHEFPATMVGKGRLRLGVRVLFKSKIFRPIFGFTLKNKEGLTIFGSNSEKVGSEEVLESGDGGQISSVVFEMDYNLAPGDYFISIGVASLDKNEIVPHDRRYDSIHLQVIDSPNFYGLTDFDLKVERYIVTPSVLVPDSQLAQ